MGILGGGYANPTSESLAYLAQENKMVRPRGFREQIQDRIAYHTGQIEQLKAVLDSMTPDVERFVEAVQKAGI